MNPRIAFAALVALFVGAASLIALELANGAANAGALAVRDPCAPRPSFSGEGLDATMQRIVLDGLDGAACELGTTREELVLSFDSELGGEVDWDQETLERALRSGLEEAIADAEERGSLGGLEARILRELVARAPLDWLIEGGGDLADLFGGIFDRR